MKQAPSREQARQWLTVQVEALFELRQVGPRDPAFREWRQTTLDMCERIWPKNPTKIKRFRRIPFQTANAKEDETTLRNAFEKGCAEARRLLLLWIAEINLHGVLKGDRVRHGAISDADIEALAGVELEPDDGTPQPLASSVPTRPGPPSLRSGDELARPPGPMTSRTGDASRKGSFRIVKVGDASEDERPRLTPELMPEFNADEDDDSSRRGKGGKKSKQRLRDMLDLDGMVHDPELVSPKEKLVEPSKKTTIPTVQGTRGRTMAEAPAEFQIERMERPKANSRGPDALERMISAAMERARTDDPNAEDDDAEDSGDLVSSPPVKREPADAAQPFHSAGPMRPGLWTRYEARPVRAAVEPERPRSRPIPPAEPAPLAPPARSFESERSRTESRPAASRPEVPKEVEVHSKESREADREWAGIDDTRNDVSREDDGDGAEPGADVVEGLMMLGADLAALGVPDTERRKVRAALLDVARRVDTGTLTWAALEEAITRSMRYPALARELLPLLLPHLDEAA